MQRLVIAIVPNCAGDLGAKDVRGDIDCIIEESHGILGTMA